MLKIIFLSSLLFVTQFSFAVVLEPGENEFFKTTDNHNLRSVKVRDQGLNYVYGSGGVFSVSQREKYKQVLKKTLELENYPFQWSLRNLSQDFIIKESRSSQLKLFGASVSKIFVAGALLNQLEGTLSNHLLTELAKMIVVSDNRSWTYLQKQIGKGDSDQGRRYIDDFTQRRGYLRTVAFQGWLGQKHGNEITAHETNQFIRDTYYQRYPGASTLWKVMYATRTGRNRGKKYLPKTMYVGGKTGTYAGSTVDPETGSRTFPDGSPYKVNVHHHALVFSCGGEQFSLVALNNTGDQEASSVLVAGLIEEHLPHCL